MIKLNQICIYPIKSLSGISISGAKALEAGLEYDRFAMLIDENNKFLSQKEYSQLALFSVSLENDLIRVAHQNSSILIDPVSWTSQVINLNMWEDNMDCIIANDNINLWFSDELGFEVKLVKKQEVSSRSRDFDEYKNVSVNLTNSHPYHILSTASLDLLNSKLISEVKIDRFRSNLVLDGLSAHQEDEIDTIKIGNAILKNTSMCFRCPVTTVDQQTAIKTKEPLKTLATYRKINNRVMFGSQFICIKEGDFNLDSKVELTFK